MAQFCSKKRDLYFSNELIVELHDNSICNYFFISEANHIFILSGYIRKKKFLVNNNIYIYFFFYYLSIFLYHNMDQIYL